MCKIMFTNSLRTKFTSLLVASILVITFLIVPHTTNAFVGEDSLLNALHSFVITVFGWLLGISGFFFDYSVKFFVLDFGNLYMTTNIGSTIDSMWATVRDIFNLSFIFGLVWIGFQIILGTNESGAKRTLVTLIGAALLVNFSLFITKFVVDFSNIAAYQIASAFVSPDQISISFADNLGVSSYFNMSNVDFSATAAGGGWSYIIGMMIIFVVLAFVFFAGAIMLTIRFVVLNIYMVLSPFMFLGWVFPSLAGTSKKYWSGFLGRAFFAPAFLFMLYLSFRVLDSYTNATNIGLQGLGNVQTQATATTIIPYLVLTVVFLVASLIVAQKMGAQGATTAINIGNSMRKGAQGMMYRPVGALAKGGVNILDRSGATNSMIGRALGARVAREGLMKGYNFGAGGRSLAKVRSDRDSEQADIIKNKSRMAAARKSVERDKDLAEAESTDKKLQLLRKKPFGSLSDKQKKELMRLEGVHAKARSHITGLVKSEIEEMSSEDRLKYATQFTTDQVAKIMESDKITSTEQDKIAQIRTDAVTSKVTEVSRATRKSSLNAKAITKLSRDEIETLGLGWLAKNVHYLTFTQVDDYLKNSKKMTPELAATLNKAREDQLLDGIKNSTPELGKILEAIKDKPKEFSKLPIQVFLDDTYKFAYKKLTVGTLEHMAAERILDQDQRKKLRTYLLNPATGTPSEVTSYLGSTKGIEYYVP
jgi:hypothetical protein